MLFDTQAAVGLSAELSAASAAEVRRKGGKPDLWLKNTISGGGICEQTLKKVQKTFAGRRRAGNVQAPPWVRRAMGRKRGKMKKTEDFLGVLHGLRSFGGKSEVGVKGEGGLRLRRMEFW